MGGCASSVLEWRSNQSVHQHPIIGPYRQYGAEAEPLPGTEQPGYSPIYRFVNTSDAEQAKLSHDFYHGATLVERLGRRAAEVPDRPAMGYRVVEQVEKRSVTDPVSGRTRTFNYYHCTPHRTIVFSEMWEMMLAFGRGLVTLGLSPSPSTIVSIYEETRWEWMISMYGIWTQTMTASTVYANLGKDALRFALGETRSDAMICNGSQVGTLTQLLVEEKLNPLVVAMDDVPAGTETHGVRVVAWNTVIAQGRAAADTVPVYTTPKSDDVCLIMYTSGTTGNPKGVMHTHGSIAAGCQALSHRIRDLYKPGEEVEIYCAYLPLAHILEFAVVNVILDRGTMVGFGTPRTLTDTYAIPHGDLTEFKPLVILSVPRIFDTIRKAVEERLPPPASFKRDIFDKAYESRRTALLEGSDTPYWNDKAFSAPRNILGGCVYGMLSGGGPLSTSTQEFLNVVCGGPLMLQGWGLTETVCCGATQRLGDLEPNCVGQLIKTCEVRLADTEDYKHTDTPEPRGELCMRGPFLFKGYYKQPELTKEAFDADGWFHTGDVGSFTSAGKLRIVGRIKALAKNCLGEYIAMEALEAVYAQNELCSVNGVCVLVHPDKSYIAALVLTEPKRALAFAEANKIAVPSTRTEGDGGDAAKTANANTKDADVATLIKSPAFVKAAVASLTLTARAASRLPFEHVKHVCVLLDEWTPENGLLTPTLKLRRSKVDAHYASTIADLFIE